MTPAAQPLVKINGLAHSYDTGLVALSGIDLAIAPASFVSLVGPSGCGKSTLLRLIAGLFTPSAGTVLCTVDGRRGELGFVFQDPTLMPWATIRDNVALPLTLRGEQSEPAEESLARVGLAEFASAYPRELSGGMRMRASIARALVTNPKLLLMDEPFAALDEFTRFKLNDDLLALWQSNRCTVVFVTHSVREAVFLSERIIVLAPRPGRIIADISVNLAYPRQPAIRHSHAFADECARVSAALGEGLESAAA